MVRKSNTNRKRLADLNSGEPKVTSVLTVTASVRRRLRESANSAATNVAYPSIMVTSPTPEAHGPATVPTNLPRTYTDNAVARAAVDYEAAQTLVAFHQQRLPRRQGLRSGTPFTDIATQAREDDTNEAAHTLLAFSQQRLPMREGLRSGSPPKTTASPIPPAESSFTLQAERIRRQANKSSLPDTASRKRKRQRSPTESSSDDGNENDAYYTDEDDTKVTDTAESPSLRPGTVAYKPQQAGYGKQGVKMLVKQGLATNSSWRHLTMKEVLEKCKDVPETKEFTTPPFHDFEHWVANRVRASRQVARRHAAEKGIAITRNITYDQAQDSFLNFFLDTVGMTYNYKDAHADYTTEFPDIARTQQGINDRLKRLARKKKAANTFTITQQPYLEDLQRWRRTVIPQWRKDQKPLIDACATARQQKAAKLNALLAKNAAKTAEAEAAESDAKPAEKRKRKNSPQEDEKEQEESPKPKRRRATLPKSRKK
jgi:hypothetical protein